ncbi:MAG: AmmeMemoRadiSam system protein B [Syntrophobacteraceae bacterium]
MAAEKIRESAISGTWYPADPVVLKQQITRYLDRANPPEVDGKLAGLVVPHAGYVYSGIVAAHAYKILLKEPFDRVLILAPSHQSSFAGSSIYNLGGYRTPLGVVPLDRKLIDDLYKYTDIIGYSPHADDREHSLEIQLPFLQTVLREFKLTPLVMGEQHFDYCARLADAIASSCEGRRVLIIASSDLSHYLPYEDARRLDGTFLDRLIDFDPEGLDKKISGRACQACGAGPVLTLMLALKKMGADSSKLLLYANSGDVTGDKSSGVVGYSAVAFYWSAAGAASEPCKPQEAGSSMGYTPEEKKKLRSLAFQAIRSRCLGEPMPEFQFDSPRLQEPRAAFVCIHKGTDLRGCIGMIEAHSPLWETVKKMAVEAAFGDPRFCSLAAEELEEIDVEISVLSPLQRISGPGEIEIGRHGILIRKGLNSGLLLPQVASEHGWNQEQFLQWTCRKAGLAENAWRKKDAELYIFSADVF